MTSPIDPIRRADRLRRAAKAEPTGRDPAESEAVNLPVPVDELAAAGRVDPPPAAATFDAHLLGQDGQKRGLRAGPTVIDTAAGAYNRAEWSGSKDRRSPKGGIRRTEV
jgi:hypothetical protein